MIRKTQWFTLCLALLFALQACNQQQPTTTKQNNTNPLFNTFNQPVDFQAITAQHIQEAAKTTMAQTTNGLDQVAAISEANRSFDNTIAAIDASKDDFGQIFSMIYLLGYTHTDSLIRNTALEQLDVLNKYNNEIDLREDIYIAIKQYAASNDFKVQSKQRQYYINKTVAQYENNGFGLAPEKREQLKALRDKISEAGNAFNANIASYKDHLIVTEAQVEGLPDDYLQARKQDDGTYKIDLSYPSYRGFMKLSKDDAARKALYLKFNNRASDKNLDVLTELLQYRLEMANLLGYKTFAQYQVSERMAATTDNVWSFENKLIDQLKAKSAADYNELLDVKKQQTGNTTAKHVMGWEAGFYNNILLKDKYQVDEQEVKQYFELNNVLKGLFGITQHIFDLTYQEVENPSVWHEDVRLFEVKKDGELIGRFYLDLHPRENKYSHAACFPMITARQTPQGYQLPTASLVCNFDAPTATTPALMPHGQVETFFHEFGHVLHTLLSDNELAGQSGFSVARDFVEAPSQFFENWTWNYQALKDFALHHETGQVLPEDLFNRMLAAKNVGSGTSTLQQVYYGMLDFTLHDKFDPNGTETTTEVVKRLQNKITPYPYVDGTHMHASFGHLNGYGASYYGYLWSLVYAQDMFSVFEQNGIMDKATGIRYRDIILGAGASEPEIELVREFLGREPNEAAFLKSLGLETSPAITQR